MTKIQLYIEMLVLSGEGQKIQCEITGMIWENEQRKILNRSMAYIEDSFKIKAKEIQVVIDKFGYLQNIILNDGAESMDKEEEK